MFSRQMVLKEMRNLLRQNVLQDFISDMTPGEYLAKMSQSGEFVDNLFLSVLAPIIKSDIVLLHVNSSTAHNGIFTQIPGGDFLSGTHGIRCPLFLGNKINSTSLLIHK